MLWRPLCGSWMAPQTPASRRSRRSAGWPRPVGKDSQRCATVVSVAPGLVPTAVFPQPIKCLRPLATAGNAYWRPPKRARRSGCGSRSGSALLPRTPQVAQRAFYTPLPLHSPQTAWPVPRPKRPRCSDAGHTCPTCERPRGSGLGGPWPSSGSGVSPANQRLAVTCHRRQRVLAAVKRTLRRCGRGSHSGSANAILGVKRAATASRPPLLDKTRTRYHAWSRRACTVGGVGIVVGGFDATDLWNSGTSTSPRGVAILHASRSCLWDSAWRPNTRYTRSSIGVCGRVRSGLHGHTCRWSRLNRVDDLKLRCYAYRRGASWEAICIDLNVAVCGNSHQEVRTSLRTAVDLYLETVADLPTAEQDGFLSRRAPWHTRAKLAILASLSALRRDRSAPMRLES